MPYPRLVRVRQKFPRPKVASVPVAVRDALTKLTLQTKIKPGQTVALTAGSRGIANIPLILKSVVAAPASDLGAKPFLVPTMGSHGGGTAEGQRKVLESYGITEDFVGVPDPRLDGGRSSSARTPEGFPVCLDKHASQADHIGVVARVKPHTSYHGPIESGLLKMMMIGLGKHAGRRLVSPHPARAALRPGGPLRRPRRCAPRRRSPSAWPSSRTATTRRP